MDYKEYSRLRSIARKRIERAAAAGRGELIKLPTVKELRQTVTNPEAFLQAVKDFLSDPGSSLKAARATGERVTRIQLPKKEPTELEKRRAKWREQKRRSRARKAVREAAESEQEARKKVGYLKALETVNERWKEAGLDIGNWIDSLSPTMAKSFANYLDYRFSQGDFKSRYTIDTFIKDFGELYRKGYNFDDIKKDFNVFLSAEKQLRKGEQETNEYGFTEEEFDRAWRKFVKYNTGNWYS